ncbi:MAG: hypothetical protein KA390_06195, partial [Trichococcus sp.]|nr:hypothetical protein [Trichococcus sp.]
MFEKINGSHYVEKDAFPALEQLLLGAGTHLFDVFNSFSYVSPLCLRSVLWLLPHLPKLPISIPSLP